MTSAEMHFRQTCVPFMALLRGDFGISDLDAAAVFGNFGHESVGLTVLQEKNPTVKGSRGGYGWPQWTGPRRRAYEAYCKRTGRDPASPKANYDYVFVELKTTEKHALAALRAARTLEDKVVAFEKAFERAGVKHYPSRQQWAKIALDAYHAAGSPVPVREVTMPVPRPPILQPGEAVGGAGAGAAGVGFALILGLPWWAWLLILAAIGAGIALWLNRHSIGTHLRIALGRL